MIVVDQLRGDVLERYRPRFGSGGFEQLFQRGLWYDAAFHPHARTETAVGHATLATGAYPSRHGLVANAWLDATGKPQDCVINEAFLVGTNEPGASPGNLRGSTLADELLLADGRNRAFAASVKDRAAVLLAGHGGKAFWFDSTPGEAGLGGSFVSSNYYFQTLPEWVQKWNARRQADGYAGQTWNLQRERSSYRFATTPIFAPDLAGYGATFPHPFGPLGRDNPAFYTKLTVSPAGDELTLEFALALAEHEQLGRRGGIDFLGLSFSSNDLVGHFFTNTSLEWEDNLLCLDRDLARLFAWIEHREELGWKNTLVILTADHGIPEAPEFLRTVPMPLRDGANATGRIKAGDLLAAAQQALKTAYQREDLLLGFHAPYFYLDRAAITAAGLELGKVEQTVADAVRRVPGVHAALAADTAEAALDLDPQLLDQLKRNQAPGRSGQVYVVQLPFWQIEETPARGEPVVLVDHGSPWSYDTFVPLVFAGAGVAGGHVSRQVSTVDLAATLAVVCKTKFPSGCVGAPLQEALSRSPASVQASAR